VRSSLLSYSIFGFTLFCAIAQAQTRSPAIPKEQSDFGAEDERWERPAPVPADILQNLRNANNATADQFSAESLEASAIHLGGPEEVDLILMGVKNLTLPHGALFWVFRPRPHGHYLVLSTGGDGLTILNSRSHGLRDIRVYGNTASTTTKAIYRFDGTRYELSNQKTTPISR
jgi:hypothetical protein